MVAAIIISLICAAFGITGGFVGFCCGYDKGWDTAQEYFEEEVKDGIQNKA